MSGCKLEYITIPSNPVAFPYSRRNLGTKFLFFFILAFALIPAERMQAWGIGAFSPLLLLALTSLCPKSTYAEGKVPPPLPLSLVLPFFAGLFLSLNAAPSPHHHPPLHTQTQTCHFEQLVKLNVLHSVALSGCASIN